jgi:hypothetical protein
MILTIALLSSMVDIRYFKHLWQQKNYDFLIPSYQGFFLVYLEKNELLAEQFLV